MRLNSTIPLASSGIANKKNGGVEYIQYLLPVRFVDTDKFMVWMDHRAVCLTTGSLP